MLTTTIGHRTSAQWSGITGPGSIREIISTPRYASAFGSAARGTMTEASDLDLLLVRADEVPIDVWEDQVTDLEADLSRWTGNDVRALEYTVGELNAARDEPVLHAILAEGLTVAGSRAWLIRQLLEPKERDGP